MSIKVNCLNPIAACGLDMLGDNYEITAVSYTHLDVYKRQIFARELTGGLYFGERYTKEIDGVRTAVDTLKYDENEIRRIAIQAFEIAMKRNKKVCSVDKANVLDSSRLWSKVVEEVSLSLIHI